MFENLDLYKDNKKMGSKEFIELCINTVVDYFNNRSDKMGYFVITEN